MVGFTGLLQPMNEIYTCHNICIYIHGINKQTTKDFPIVTSTHDIFYSIMPLPKAAHYKKGPSQTMGKWVYN